MVSIQPPRPTDLSPEWAVCWETPLWPEFPGPFPLSQREALVRGGERCGPGSVGPCQAGGASPAVASSRALPLPTPLLACHSRRPSAARGGRGVQLGTLIVHTERASAKAELVAALHIWQVAEQDAWSRSRTRLLTDCGGARGRVTPYLPANSSGPRTGENRSKVAGFRTLEPGGFSLKRPEIEGGGDGAFLCD